MNDYARYEISDGTSCFQVLRVEYSITAHAGRTDDAVLKRH